MAEAIYLNEGRSAYEIWLAQGNTGTEDDFLASLQGNSGYQGAAGELEVKNNLTEGGATAALSAEMGKQLNKRIYGSYEIVQESEAITLPNPVGGTYQNASGSDVSTTYGAWFGAGNGRTSGFIDLRPFKELGYRKLKVTMAAYEENVHSSGRLTFVKKGDNPTSSSTGMSYDSLVAAGYLSIVHDAYNKVVITCSAGTTTLVEIPEDAIGVYFQYRSAIEGSTAEITYRKPKNVFAFEKQVFSNGDIQKIQHDIEELKQKDIQDNSVTTQKIANGAVTEEKLADGVVCDALVSNIEEYESFNLIDFEHLEWGKYLNDSGKLVSIPGGSDSYRVSNLIPLHGKKIYYGNLCMLQYGTMKGTCLYAADGSFIRAFSAGGSGSYDPASNPNDNAAYIRFTMTGYTSLTTSINYVVYAKSDGTNPMIDQLTGLVTNNFDDLYRQQVIKHSKLSSILTKESMPDVIPAISAVGQDGISKIVAEVGPETEQAYITSYVDTKPYPLYLKCCHTISFKGYLSDTLGGSDYIRFGINRNNTSGKVVDITPTKAIVKRYDSTHGYVENISFNHNLTIEDFIMCEVNWTWHGGKMRIVTSNGAFVQEWTNSQYQYTGNAQTNYGRAFLEPTVVLTNVKISQSSDRFMKPVWVLGDSFQAMQTNRWTYQMINTFGIDGFLLDGFAGAKSSDIYPELIRLLRYGTPKYLLWGLGGNDGPASWKYYATAIEMLCREKGITLIYKTTCRRDDDTNTVPSSYQEVITQYVKDSGYRYFDERAAVSADSEGNWYSGMRDTDNCHPTLIGALAMAGQVLVDFPELSNYK